MPFNWFSDPEGSQESSPAYGYNPNAFGASPEPEWVDAGIFERNTRTGEMRLKNKIGAMGGLADDLLGHYTKEDDSETPDNELNTSFVPTIKITSDEDDVLDDMELKNLNRSMDEGPLGWVGWGGSTLKRMGLSYLEGPATSLLAMETDMIASALDTVGADAWAKYMYTVRDDVRDYRQLIIDQGEELSPPTISGNPIRDLLWEEPKEFIKEPTFDNLKDVVGRYNSFVIHTGGPMFLAQMINLLSAGSGAAVMALLYGSMGLGDTYDAVRYDDRGNEKHSPYTAYVSAVPAAIASGWLEKRGYKGVWKDSGGKWLKGTINAGTVEAQTGGLQAVSDRLFRDLPDFTSDYLLGDNDLGSANIRKYLNESVQDVGWSALGEATGGAGTRAMGSALVSKDSRNQQESRSWKSLSALNQEQAFIHMGQLKAYLDSTGASPLNWKPAHAKAVEAINDKWGHISEVATALKQVVETKNDPIQAGKEQALLDRTSGATEVIDLSAPDVDSWNRLRLSNHGPSKAVAINQFLQARDVISPLETAAIAATSQAIDYTTMSPTDIELYVSSLNKAKIATPKAEDKVKLQEAIDQTVRAVDGVRESPEFQIASQGFEMAWQAINGPATQGMPQIPTALGLIGNAIQQAEASSGRWVSRKAQDSIIRIQEALKMAVLSEQDPTKAAQVAGPAYQAIKALNNYLIPADITTSDEKHIDPIEALKALNEEITASKQRIATEEQQLVSGVMMMRPGARDAAAFGTNEASLGEMASQIVQGKNQEGKVVQQLPNWVSRKLRRRIDSIHKAGSNARAAIMQSIKEESLAMQARVERSLAEKYRMAAREQAAKGTESNPIIANMIREDVDVIKERKKAVHAQQMALNDARRKVSFAFRQAKLTNDASKVTVDGNAQALVRNAHNLNAFIEQITDELSNGYSQEETGLNEMDVEEAMTELASQISMLGRGRVGVNKDGEPFATPDMVRDVNKLLSRLGVLYPWEVDSTKRQSQQTAFKVYAQLPQVRAMLSDPSRKVVSPNTAGEVTPFDSSDGVYVKGTPRIDKTKWNESAVVVANLWEQRKKEMQSDPTTWNDQEAATMWKLLDQDRVSKIVAFLDNADLLLQKGAKRSDLPLKARQGMGILEGYASQVVKRNTRGTALDPKELTRYATDWANPDKEPTANKVRLGATAVDAYRTGNILKRLMSRQGAAAGKDKNAYKRYQDVIRSLLGTRNSTGGEAARARFDAMDLKLKKDNLQSDMQRESADAYLANPVEELRGIDAHLRESSGVDDVVTELGDADPETIARVQQEIEGDLFAEAMGTEEVRYGLKDPNEGIEAKAEEALKSRLSDVSVTKRRVKQDERTIRDQRMRDDWKRGKGGELNKEVTVAWNKANALREMELLEFYEVMKELGYTFANQEEIDTALRDQSFDQGLDYTRSERKKSALKYLDKVNKSVKAAMGQSSTPAGFALALKVNGYTDQEITLSLALIDGMASQFARNTKRNKAELWHMAALAVAGEPVDLVTKKATGGSTFRFPGLNKSAFTKMKKGLIKFTAKLLDPSGRANVFTAAHEVMHSLISSGYLREMLDPKDVAAIERWIGAKLPSIRNGETYGHSLKKEQEEMIISAAEMSIAVSGVAAPEGERDYLHEAFASVRATTFNFFSHLLSNSQEVGYTGISMMAVDNTIPEDARHALLSIFGVNKAIPAIYSVTQNGIILTAAHKLVGMVNATMGVDISPYLQGQFDNLNGVLNESATLRSILRIATAKRVTPATFRENAPTFTEYKRMIGVTGRVSDSVLEHLEVIYESLLEDADQLEEWSHPVFATVSLSDLNAGYVRQYRQIFGLDAKEKEQVAAGLDVVSGAIPDDMTLEELLEAVENDDSSTPDPEGELELRRHKVAKAAEKKAPQVAARMAETILHQVTPLSHTDTRAITEPLVRFLGAHLPPSLTGNNNNTSKNAQNIMVRAITTMMDDLGDMFSSRTHGLEKLLLKMGLSREYLMVLNMGGLYAQARAQVEDKVVVLEGNAQLGREKWRIINEGLRDIIEEIPEEMQADVWAYLRARREMELATNNLKDMKDYEQKLLAHAADPEHVPYPQKPDPVPIDANHHAAAVVLSTVLDAKYGKDGGIVGEYASRIVKFENAAIAYKLHHYGMISEKEYRDLVNKGQWWMPSARMQRLAKDLEHMESFYNDGTKPALKNVSRDMSSIDHPFQELQRRVISTHLLTQKAFVRSSLLRSLIHDENGNRISDDNLDKKLGIIPLYTTVNRRVSREEWLAAPPDKYDERTSTITEEEWERSNKKGPIKRDNVTKQLVYSVKVKVPLDRRGFEAWQAANPGKNKQVYAKWENGEAEYFLVNDSHLRKAIDSMGLEELPKALKIIAHLTGLMAALITLNPKFIVGMPFKDIGNALARSQGGMNLLTLPFDFMNGMFHSLPYMFPSLARRMPNTFWAYNERSISLSNQTALADSFNERGVSIHKNGYKGESVARGIVDDIAAIFREPNDYKTLRNVSQFSQGLNRVWGTVKRGVVGTIETLKRTARMVDSAFRMQERILLKSGNLGDLDRIRNMRLREKNDPQSPLHNRELDSPGYMSDLYVDAMDRQLTLDFARKGSVVKKWGSLKMFAGPMFQDTVTTNQRIWDPIARKGFIMKGVLTLTWPALAMWAIWHDDEDWQRLSYWDKFNYFQISKNAEGKFDQLPAPIGLAALIFKDSALAMAQILSEKDPQAGTELAYQVLSQTPLQYQPFGQKREEWVTHIAPTLIEGSVETALNYNPLSHSPIDYDIGKQQAQLPEDRGIEKYGIVESVLARAFDTSPRLTGYWLKQQFPGVAQPIFQGVDAALTAGYQAMGGDSRIGTDTPDALQFISKWSSGNIYGATSLPVNRFYEMYTQSSNSMESIQQAYENGANDRALALVKAHPEAYYSEYFKKVYGQIQQLKIQRGLYMKALTPEERKERKAEIVANYDVPMTLLAEEALREYNHLKETTYNK